MTSLDDLLRAGSRDYLARNGVPTDDDAADRERAQVLIRDALGQRLTPDGLVRSPLGAGWTDVFEAHLGADVDIGSAALRDRGWLRIDGLRQRLGGAVTDSSAEWAVVADGRVLAAVRLNAGGRSDPVATIIERARARAEVRLREMLELRELVRDGHELPASSAVLRSAADIEGGLQARELVRWTSGRRLAAPVALPPRSARRARRLVVACSGVDGAGKTSLSEGLAEALTRAGVPVSRVWLRPGMGLGAVAALAGRVKRALGLDPRPGVAVVATEPDVQLRSRTGAVGWAWSLLVVVMFVSSVRRQHASSRGVVLWDRHLLDALTTLDFAYAGVDMRWQRLLLRRLLPAADATLYLNVSLEEALARKPGDVIGESAVRRQLDAYAAWMPQMTGVHVLDAQRSVGELVQEALSVLAGSDPSVGLGRVGPQP